ncbi:MAG: LacI family DNA-binding transcriptional regulator [Spirochaetales bacterium]
MAVNIQEVARQSGVAISTVSKVINGTGRISEETAKRVRKVMKDLDYHPSQIARNFVLQSSNNIAVVMQFQKNSIFQGPYYFEILGGIEQVLQREGYMVSVLTVDDDRDLEGTVERLVQTKKVDGLIIHSSAIETKVIPYAQTHHLPVVVIGNHQGGGNFCTVDVDDVAAGRLATSHLVVRGMTNPGFFGGPADDPISQNRCEGYRTELKASHVPFREDLIVGFPIADQTGSFEALEAVLGRPVGVRPDGVVCTSNFVAALVYRVALHLGLRIPEDLGVVAFDNYPLAPFLTPGLTVVTTDLYGLGSMAARTLLATLRDVPTPVHSLVGRPELIIRESC